MSTVTKYKYNRIIRIWLWIGLIMLIGQVVLGGITRLTGSGLSITKWDVITGVVPPLNADAWEQEFELYKATPQFEKINSSFTLKDFKLIYFWEYAHRLWVRSLGMIFIIPFMIFLFRKKIDMFLIKRLGLVVLLTLLTASAGWIMVQSGLVDRPWVNAYKLTIHFVLAVLVILAMLKTVWDTYILPRIDIPRSKSLLYLTIGLTFIQLIIAGLMSGMRAGLYYPSWPDMNGEFVPGILKLGEQWTWQNMQLYDSVLFAPALVQFGHRMLAYLLVILTVYLFVKYKKILTGNGLTWLRMAMIIVLVQVLLGILTVLNVAGKIPLFLGVAHQLFGLLYFMVLVLLNFSWRRS